MSQDETEKKEEIKQPGLQDLIRSSFGSLFNDKEKELEKRIDTVVSQKLNELIAFQDEIGKVNQKLSETNNLLSAHESYLTSTKETFQNELSQVEKLKAQATDTYEEIQRAKDEINKTYLSIFGSEIETRKYLSPEEISEIKTDQNGAQIFRNERVFEAKDKQGNSKPFIVQKEKKPGVIDELKRRQDTYDSVLNKLKNDFEEELKENRSEIGKYFKESKDRNDELFNKIEESYSTAIAVGLSKAYKIAKENHKTSLSFWSWISIGSVLLMIGIPFSLEWWIFEAKITSIDSGFGVFKRILTYLPFISPLVYLSYIASKNMNGYRRMYEEYMHKESLSLTYEGLKREIENSKDENSERLLTQLLQQSLDATKNNPSSFLENIGGESFFNVGEIFKAKSVKIGRNFFGKLVEIEELSRVESDSGPVSANDSSDRIKKAKPNETT